MQATSGAMAQRSDTPRCQVKGSEVCMAKRAPRLCEKVWDPMGMLLVVMGDPEEVKKPVLAWSPRCSEHDHPRVWQSFQ